MSAFQVAVTPPRIQNARKASALREPTQVVLALFSAKSIVTFEDIPVTKTAKRCMNIHNPTDDVLKVLITKIIRPEANVTFEWTSKEIPPRSYASLELIWSPQVEWATREIVQFTDNRNFKKDVAVILKSIDKSNVKKKSANTKKPLERSITRKLVIKSPSPRSRQRGKIAAANMNGMGILPSIENHKPDDVRVPIKVLGTQNCDMPRQASATTIKTDYFNVNIDAFGFSNAESKENMHPPPPSTPMNGSDIFDSIQFTPVSDRKQNGRQNIDFLASLPTPTSAAKGSSQCRNPTVQDWMRDLRSDLDPEPLDLSLLQHPLNLTLANERTPMANVNNQTTVLSSAQTPQANGDYFLTPARGPLFLQQTPVIVYNQQYDVTNRNNQAKLSTTYDKSPCRSPSPLNRSRSPISNGRHSPFMNRTYETPFGDQMVPANRTRILSPAPDPAQLYVIHEEHTSSEMRETFIKPTYHERTYNVVKADTLARDVKLLGSPLRKKFQSMKDLSNGSQNLSLEQQMLRNNQGSMPNLNNLEQVKSIENNRYFCQSIEKDLQDQNEHMANNSVTSMYSAISTHSVTFQEHEILAQSSRFNINDIGKSRPSIAQNDYRLQPSTCYFIESRDEQPKTGNRPFPPHTKQRQQSNSNQVASGGGSIGRPSVIASIGHISNSSALSSSLLSSMGHKRARDENLRASQRSLKASPPKRVRMNSNAVESPRAPRGQSFRTKTWGDVQAKKFRIPKVPIQKLVLNKKEEERIVLYDPDLHLQGVINPDAFAATTTLDPFLSATMFLDERCVDMHETQFKKWLNALVAIPEDMNESAQKLDFGKLFNDVKNRNVALAPTKETVSANYLTKHRLESLRQTAIAMYTSAGMRESMERLMVHIEKKSIQIRRDRNLHQDVVLQREILELLLCINPLWLRIGLEVVFGETIPMQNNQDIVALSTFILNRLFRDKYLEAKYHKSYAQTEQYAEHIKKYTLKRVLCLLCFLDVAKTQKIIKHNPCLFLKSSAQKKTKDILLKFSSSLLGNIGDIQRDLKRIGIILTHEQNYIDEFDYAFRNLAIDLRDGVRLSKVMEIILLREDLTRQLRVPAISRSQRIHNVGVALNALQGSGFTLTGNITPADIADGHREKTLSLLWQIIYIFRAPKFNAAATVIQNWWRKKSLFVCIQRRIRERKERHLHQAACVIQSAWRGHLTRRDVKEFRERRSCAALVIQTYARRFLTIKHFNYEKSRVVLIQRRIREWLATKHLSHEYQQKRQAAIKIQKWYRRMKLAQKVEGIAQYIGQIQSNEFQATVKIQTWFRACLLAKKERTEYLTVCHSIIVVQQRFRAQLAMRKARSEFVVLKQSAICFQQQYRALIAMREQRTIFVQQKQAAINLQRRFRANQQMKCEQKRFVLWKNATITIQRQWRAQLAMRKEKKNYDKMQKAAIVLQRQFRAKIAMKKQRNEYLRLRWAAIVFQRHFRAQLEMRKQKQAYIVLRQSCITIQQHFRAKLLARKVSVAYVTMRQATVVIQRQYRAQKAMEVQRVEYKRILHATLVIQRARRATLAMRENRTEYQILQKNVLNMQRRFRASRLMVAEVDKYTQLKNSATCLQAKWRAVLAMRKQREEFTIIKMATICIQQHLRATLQMRQERQQFLLHKKSATIIQQHYRSTILARQKRDEFQQVRKSAITIQRFYRGYKQMRKDRAHFLSIRSAAITIQHQFVAYRLMTMQRQKYEKILDATRIIQTRFRAELKMRLQRGEYVERREAAIKIQRYFRSYLETKRLCKEYLQLRSSAICIQTRFRANCLMKQTVNQYQLVRTLVICIQQKFRANIQMRVERGRFLELKRAAITIQQRCRANQLRDIEQKRFTNMKSMLTMLQARIRGNQARERYQKLMSPEMVELREKSKAAKKIQSSWRGYWVRRQRTKQLAAICEKAKRLQQTAVITNTIRNRVQLIVRFLKQRFNTNDALNVLRELEYISRTVPQTLQMDSRYIASFCYAIMRQAIRSEVDKLIISLCCKIILNLARYEPTRENAFQIACFETVAQILARWCDKESDIFNILCTVIWVFIQCPIKNQQIGEFMHSHDARYLLKETKKLTFRKENMRQNVRVRSASSAPIISPRDRKKLPMINTNFDVNTSNNYIFNSSVFALDTILNNLNIVL